MWRRFEVRMRKIQDALFLNGWIFTKNVPFVLEKEYGICKLENVKHQYLRFPNDGWVFEGMLVINECICNSTSSMEQSNMKEVKTVKLAKLLTCSSKH